MPSTRQQLNRCWVLGNSLGRTMEDTKNTKDPKKGKESPELKEELTDEELSGLSGGHEHEVLTKKDLCEGGSHKQRQG